MFWQCHSHQFSSLSRVIEKTLGSEKTGCAGSPVLVSEGVTRAGEVGVLGLENNTGGQMLSLPFAEEYFPCFGLCFSHVSRLVNAVSWNPRAAM